MIVLVSNDEFMCFYRNSITFNCLLVHMHNSYPCTSQEVTALKILNLRIVQYKNGIRFDKISYIKQTFVDAWLPNPTDISGVCYKPLKTDTTHEMFLDTLQIQTKGMAIIEMKYGGLRFNAHIVKYLNI